MRVYISIDMEGVSGLVRWPDVAKGGQDYPRGRAFLTGDVNAAVAGAFDAGADEVVVEENHGVEDLCNVLMDEVDPRCSVIRGAGRPGATTMAGLTAEVDVMLLVGHHARAGSHPGIMAHTISYGAFRAVRLDGRDFGEPEMFATRAAELGVPVGLICGDQVVADQLRKCAPDAEAVIVKRALSRVAAECIPPARAQAMIRAGAERAVQRARARKLALATHPAPPYAFEVELREEIGEGLRANLEKLPEFEITGPKTVATRADDMETAFRRVAYLGFGDRPGLLRY